MPVQPLAGKVVIDTGNYYPDRGGRIAELDDESTTSELLQEHLPASKVVKAFSNIVAPALEAPARPAETSSRADGYEDPQPATPGQVRQKLAAAVRDLPP